MKVIERISILFFTAIRVGFFLLGKKRINRFLAEHLTLHNQLFPQELRAKFVVLAMWHEKEVSRFLKKISGEVFIDVGAGVGYYSLLLKDNFRKIYAFEPSPSNFKLMIRNLRQFRAKNIQPIMKTISNFNGVAFLYLAEQGKYHKLSSAYQLLQKSSLRPKIGKIKSLVTVKTVTLARFFSLFKLIDLIKVDVEGSEWDVLEGSFPIMDRIKRWVVELHDLSRKEDIEKLFYSKGFSTRWLDFNHIYAWRKNHVRPINENVRRY